MKIGFTYIRHITLVFISIWIFTIPCVTKAAESQEMNLEEAIQRISIIYDVYFTYNKSLVQNYIVNFDEDAEMTLVESMEHVLGGTSLRYRIHENKYVIIYKRDREGISSLKEMARHLDDLIDKEEEQSKRDSRLIDLLPALTITKSPLLFDKKVELNISGVVTDQSGNPLIGVNVLVKGTNKGTATDLEGRFYLEDINENDVLVISYVGYQLKEVPLAGRTSLEVILIEDSQLLDEVVVVGYGTQKKASLVGSIVQASGEELERAGGVTNLAQALTGKLPGVATVQQTGEPGADDPRILIRGQGSWNGSDPLILVDGIERRMNDLDISEVENISVLKDASATAVFGVKGAEGVILITTKRGKIGKPVITADVNFSTKSISKVPEKLNSYDQFTFRNQVIEYELNHGGQTNWEEYMPQDILHNYQQPQDQSLKYIFPDVDWVDEMVKPFPLSSRVNLNVSGGTDFARYFSSISYSYDDDLIRTGVDPMNAGYKSKIAYERVNFRTNLDLNMTRSTVLSVNLAGWVGNKTAGFGDSEADVDIFRAFAETSPDEYPILQADGSYGFNPNSGHVNPFLAANSQGVGENRRINVNTDFILKQRLDFITEGLSLRGSFSFDNTLYTSGGVMDGGQARTLYIEPGIIDIKPGERPEDYMQGYIHNQGANHDYDWVQGSPERVPETSDRAGATARRLFYQFQLIYSRSFNKHDIGALGLVNREQFAIGSMFPRYREDWVGRVTYGFDNRYLLESNFAYNGSEKFGPGYRFGFFPSVAAGWIISNESFFQQDWLTNLKVRYSIGKVGSDNFSSPRWAYQTNWALDRDNTFFGYPQLSQSPYNQYIEVGIGNPDLSWEVSLKQNLGLEIAILDNKLGLNLDLFQDHRTNIFLNASQRDLAPYFGQKPVSANLGEVKVKGYEVEFTYRNSTSSDLYYSFSASHTGAFDKILYMEDPPLLPDYLKNEGYAIGQRRAQIEAGFLNNWDEVYSAPAYQSNNQSKLPGDYRILDFNASGLLDANSAAPYAYPIDRPQHTYNLALGLEYRGFGFNVQFHGMYNILREYTGWLRVPFYNRLTTGEVMRHHLDMWTPENPNGTYRHQRIDFQGNPGYATTQYTDGSFFRMKTAEVAYTLTSAFFQRIGANSVRLYLNGNNLIFWSKMVEDREMRGDDTVNSVYPMTKRFNLGLKVKF